MGCMQILKLIFIYILVYSRWLRLLFGREFTILDLLTIWDVIFADQSSQSMVNYVFVALLVQIRQLRLYGYEEIITIIHSFNSITCRLYDLHALLVEISTNTGCEYLYSFCALFEIPPGKINL
jgi:hypothetical protein